jgi:hypothetical protein
MMVGGKDYYESPLRSTDQDSFLNLLSNSAVVIPNLKPNE